MVCIAGWPKYRRGVYARQCAEEYGFSQRKDAALISSCVFAGNRHRYRCSDHGCKERGFVAAAKADKRYRAILKLYVAFVAFITVCLGVFNVHARSDWAMADWLINYTGGFVRRGFTGQIALETGRLHLSPLVFVLLVQLALYALILYAVLQLTENIEWNVWTIALVYSPATLGFALNDPSYAYRKEILFFALLGGTLLMLQRRRWNDLALSTLLTVSAAVCVLSHEALIVFFPYLFCALLIGFRRVDRAVRVAAVPAIVAAGCFVLVSRFPGSLAM